MINRNSTQESHLSKILQPDVVEQNLNKSTRAKFIQFLNEATSEASLEYYQSSYTIYRDTIKYLTACHTLAGNTIV